MKQLSKKFATLWQIDAAAVALCAICSLGGYLLIVQPAQARREAMEETKRRLDDRRAEVSKASGALRGMRGQLSRLQEELGRASVNLRESSAINSRIAELTGLASQEGLEVQYVQPGIAVSGSRYGQVPITLNALGSYRNSAAFLHQLKRTLPDLAVRSFSMTTDASDPAAKTAIDLKLVWYVQPLTSQK